MMVTREALTIGWHGGFGPLAALPLLLAVTASLIAGGAASADTVVHIFFESNTFNPTNLGRAQIEVAQEALDADQESIAYIFGHSDRRGSSAVIERISAARALAVAEILLANDVSGARIASYACGDSYASSASPERYWLDRKVELVVSTESVASTVLVDRRKCIQTNGTRE